MNKTALIVGGSGQFGFYIAKLLLQKSYKVYISTRSFKNHKLNKFRLLKKKINFVKINILKNSDIKREILTRAIIPPIPYSKLENENC